MKDSEKTKAQLLQDLRTLRRHVAELQAANSEREHAEEKINSLRRELEERTKEMDCLYAISRLRDEPGISYDKILQEVVELLPPAWQYTDITCARLTLQGERKFQTLNFGETPWRQAGEIVTSGKRKGVLEVFCLERRPDRDEGPFLKEERNLLEAICERVGKILELKQAEEEAKQKEQQLIQLDKMVAVGTLVSGVAHEINNPNNFIMLNAPVLQEAYMDIMPILEAYFRENGEFMMGGLSYTEMRENIAMLFSGILEGSKRIKNIVERLKDFARSDTPDLTELADLNAVVKTAITLVSNQIMRSTKKFSVQYGSDLPKVKGSFQRLEQVIINLVQNACEALVDNEKAIVLTTSYDPEGCCVVIEVQDEGAGISPDCLIHITDPFYTTKRHRGGTGLGLSVSCGIVKDHGGALNFSSTPGKGTTATLKLPAQIDNNARGKEMK